MHFGIFTIFRMFGIMSAWAEKALADNKITLQEALDLIAQLAASIEIPLEFDVPGTISKVTATTEQAPAQPPAEAPGGTQQPSKPIQE